MLDESTFDSINKVSIHNEEFDEIMNLRGDLGEILRHLCKCLGPMNVLPIYGEEIGKSMAKLQDPAQQK